MRRDASLSEKQAELKARNLARRRVVRSASPDTIAREIRYVPNHQPPKPRLLHEGALALFGIANEIEIRRKGFRAELNRTVSTFDQWPGGFVPDGFRIVQEGSYSDNREAWGTVYLYEVENTHALTEAKFGKILDLWAIVDDNSWFLELIVIGRDGRLVNHWTDDALSLLWFARIKTQIDGKVPW